MDVLLQSGGAEPSEDFLLIFFPQELTPSEVEHIISIFMIYFPSFKFGPNFLYVCHLLSLPIGDIYKEKVWLDEEGL